MPVESSRLPGFHKKDLKERLEEVAEMAGLEEEERKVLLEKGLSLDGADGMIENVVGTIELPIGISTNFMVNEKDYLVPMAIEESSVVAAASKAAKLARESGGFYATTTDPVMISQVQITGLSDPHRAKAEVLENEDEIIKLANEQDPVLVEHGGGMQGLECRVLRSEFGPYLVVHLLVDCRDAMGANAVNTMAEAVAPFLEDLTGGKVYLRILSNLADKRLARARVQFDKETIGEETVEGVLQAYEFARIDPYRCATHNKGVMNGVTSIVTATGNDTRAMEAGAHSYASAGGGYSPLTKWEKTEDGHLAGSIEIPVPVGMIGGATSSHPVAGANLSILDVESAAELGEVMASVGLAQNFAALRALATEGIQEGHMKLHAKNVAIAAGADEDMVDEVAEKMVEEGEVRADRAEELIEELSDR